ncbi:MAG: Re/Si-specific NAD(P)(+) transhydrogenase subunit alpha [Alphaproteobacteria bacterium]
MQIAILKERRPHEYRVACAPDIIEKLVKDGHQVTVETGAGDSASFEDQAFEAAGATIAADPKSTVSGAAVIFKIQRPLLKELSLFSKGQTLICHAQALTDKETMTALNAQGVQLFALELLPRITRAQSMDILSSQANMAGYKAVLDALEHYGRAMPMMSTAAGRVQPANVFIMGVGVAGLQAIATAKRLGAIVHATDVRPATKEQVQSLGGKFVAVEDDEFLEAQTAGGYAKEMSDAYKKKQASLIDETIKTMDIVITTALIPGRPAPVLINEDQVKSMKPGSIIVDLAVEAGGNCPLSEFGKVVTKHGVTLVGHANVPSRLASTTSQLFARNLYNFITPLIDKESKNLAPDLEDEIVKGTLVCSDGNFVHSAFITAPEAEKDDGADETDSETVKS